MAGTTTCSNTHPPQPRHLATPPKRNAAATDGTSLCFLEPLHVAFIGSTAQRIAAMSDSESVQHPR